MDPSKVQAVLKWPKLQNTKEVRGFLGLTGFYCRFIRDYGKIAEPVTLLTKKDKLGLSGEAQAKAFEHL